MWRKVQRHQQLNSYSFSLLTMPAHIIHTEYIAEVSLSCWLRTTEVYKHIVNKMCCMLHTLDVLFTSATWHEKCANVTHSQSYSAIIPYHRQWNVFMLHTFVVLWKYSKLYEKCAKLTHLQHIMQSSNHEIIKLLNYWTLRRKQIMWCCSTVQVPQSHKREVVP